MPAFGIGGASFENSFDRSRGLGRAEAPRRSRARTFDGAERKWYRTKKRFKHSCHLHVTRFISALFALRPEFANGESH